jgi:hypothetical protein
MKALIFLLSMFFFGCAVEEAPVDSKCDASEFYHLYSLRSGRGSDDVFTHVLKICNVDSFSNRDWQFYAEFCDAYRDTCTKDLPIRTIYLVENMVYADFVGGEVKMSDIHLDAMISMYYKSSDDGSLILSLIMERKDGMRKTLYKADD